MSHVVSRDARVGHDTGAWLMCGDHTNRSVLPFQQVYDDGDGPDGGNYGNRHADAHIHIVIIADVARTAFRAIVAASIFTIVVEPTPFAGTIAERSPQDDNTEKGVHVS